MRSIWDGRKYIFKHHTSLTAISYLTLCMSQSTASTGPLQLVMIIQKNHLRGSGSFCLYRRRYNVVGDLMRPSETPASTSLKHHIVSHAVHIALNSFYGPIVVGHDSMEASFARLKLLVVAWCRYIDVVNDLMRPSERPQALLSSSISYLTLCISQSTAYSGPL